MLSVSEKYKEYVYTMDKARHFIPYALLQIIDVLARTNCTYTLDNAEPYSNRAQLYDEEFEDVMGIGYCEPDQYILDGSMDSISSTQITEGSIAGQIGVIGSCLSDADGNYATPLTLTCIYSSDIVTAGRTLCFNNKEESNAAEYTLEYYSGDTLLTSTTVVNTGGKISVSTIAVENFNKLVIKITKSNRPYSRVKLVEDIPGVMLQFGDRDVVSMNYNTGIDILMDELITSEMDMVIRNDDNALDIFNDAGIEKYLQRRQPMNASLIMMYPDATYEEIPVGKLYTSTWKINKGTLEASFTLRDILDRLYLDDYIKGMYYVTATNFYGIAEDVLQTAGVVDYTIDAELQNIYTFGILPICSYKEALRQIAQATCSVVLIKPDSTVHIKYVGIPTNWPTAIDTLSDQVQYEMPEIQTSDAYKRIEVQEYQYTVDSVTSEVYKSVHSIAGTKTITCKYTMQAKDVVATLSTGTLVSAAYYTNAAVLTVTSPTTDTTTDITISMAGKKITAATVEHSIDNQIDNNLVADAKVRTVDNKLISTSGVAINVMNFGAYWVTRRYRYDIDWRQNPAIELLDPVTVYDKFDKNNTTLIYEQNLDYTSGALSGNSKALF